MRAAQVVRAGCLLKLVEPTYPSQRGVRSASVSRSAVCATVTVPPERVSGPTSHSMDPWARDRRRDRCSRRGVAGWHVGRRRRLVWRELSLLRTVPAWLVDRLISQQTALCRQGTDELYDHLVTDQRLAAPVLADECKQPVLDFVPLCALPRCTDVVSANPAQQLEVTNGLKHFGKRPLPGVSGPYGRRARYAPHGLTGVHVAARMAEHRCATREVCPGGRSRRGYNRTTSSCQRQRSA